MGEYIDRDAFLEQKRAWYCKDCDRRKNTRGKFVYEIGEGMCKACDIGTMLDAVEDYPAADVGERNTGNWIPVTERLPDNIDEEVLVCTEDYGKSGLGFVTVAIYDGSGWLECWERKTYLTAVTHWMPLPEPPKEET